jgi:hypothetical protein
LSFCGGIGFLFCAINVLSNNSDGEDEMDERFALTNQKEETETAESDEYLIEITTYIREDQAWALEILGFRREQMLGVNFDRATMIREALDLLMEKYDIRPGKWPDKWPGKRLGSAR